MMPSSEQKNRHRQRTSRRYKAHAADLRERIFRAAIELIAQRGLDQVTIGDITERADVGKGTFFNYFSNKEAVLRYFGANQLERLQGALDSGTIAGTARERIVQVLVLYAEHPALTPDLARALYVTNLSLATMDEAEGPNIWQRLEILAEIIRDGQQQHEFRTDQSPRDLALFLYGQFILAMLTWSTGFSQEALPQTVHRFTSLALDGLTPEAGAVARRYAATGPEIASEEP